MFHDGMAFILYTPEEAAILGRMLSSEGIFWGGGQDPATRQFFDGDCTLWFISSRGIGQSLKVTYAPNLSCLMQDILEHAKGITDEPPIEFCAWYVSAAQCTPDSIDDLI